MATQASDYDAIIVGGGHNGLTAAAYLARSGARTLVLESRSRTGGAATTEAPWPDAPEFRVTRLSYVMSLMPPTIINDLDLARHGYKIFPMGPYYQAFPEGGSIKLYADDAQRNHDEVSRWSKKDADAMPRWDAWLAAGRSPRPAAADRAAEPRLPQAERPQGDAPPRLAPPWPGRAHDRRRDPADDHVDCRPARRLV
jgi:phytoene dehydrogenase-like protein